MGYTPIFPGKHERHVFSYLSDPEDGVSVEVIEDTGFEGRLMNITTGRRKIMTEFPPDPQRYPHKMGEAQLKFGPRTRMVVRRYTCNEDGTGHAEIIYHTKYQPKWSERLRKWL